MSQRQQGLVLERFGHRLYFHKKQMKYFLKYTLNNNNAGDIVLCVYLHDCATNTHF